MAKNDYLILMKGANEAKERDGSLGLSADREGM